MTFRWIDDQAASAVEKTKPVIIELLNQQMSNKEMADELNQRQLYMASGASWNAGRIDMFVTKHQIESAHP